MQRAKNEEERQAKSRRSSDLNSEYNNPCLREHQMSAKCLNDNNFDREKCSIHFVNYNNCKDFWGNIRAERRAKGIRPALPLPEDRDAIKKEFMLKFHNKQERKE